MPFSLPSGFEQRTDLLTELVIECETAIEGSKRDDATRQALSVACENLKSLNLEELSREIDDILSDAKTRARLAKGGTTWAAAIFGDFNHFKFFLSKVEGAILSGAGMSDANRKRVLRELKELRYLAKKIAGSIDGTQIVEMLDRLRELVCNEGLDLLRAGRQKIARRLVIKSMCGSAMVLNVAGPTFLPGVTAAGMAASIALGGAALRFVP